MNQLYHIYHKYKNLEFIYIIPLVLLALDKKLDHYFWRLRSGYGFPQSEDSQWYIDYAHNLMATYKIGLTMNDLLYVGYNVLLTVLLAIVKEPENILLIQAVTASLNVILVYLITRKLFNRLSAIFASYFYSEAWDTTLWAMYILSESFFISVMLLCIYFLVMMMDTKQRKYQILFAVTAFYMMIFRPTGIILLAFIFGYILYNLKKETILHFVKKYRYVLGGLITAVVVAAVYFLAGDKLEPLVTSMQFNAKKVMYNIYAKGWIYDKPTAFDAPFKPDYNINILNSLVLSFIINNWDHVMAIYGRRSIAFFGPWVWETNIHTLHGIKKLILNLIPTGLFLAGTVGAFMNKQFKKVSIVWLIILSIFIFCVIFFIDWMYRYKVPATPFIAIAAGYGAERIIHVAIVIAKKYTGLLLHGSRQSADRHTSV
ncbi:glycosyltransferase family 39 protein [Paenibacillus cremeus]|uniref:Glycosyltransferase family 39 protein n=1 Tax=Paenibacillus cremeus TaxID=2163881 RepID=A0A559KDA9_9BACL|nr:glycosyltransferase family 39 protein [Paenibacillus cremeus]TVY10084.1 glycosyltransferase family 39 protein [Paenibacillus cremeus]